MRYVMSKLAYLIFLVLVSFIALEGAARLLFPRYADDEVFLERAFYKVANSYFILNPARDNYSPVFGFRLPANAIDTVVTEEYTYTIQTNSLGFRTREVQPRQEHEYRILLLGDSMIFGVGVEDPDQIATLLERYMAARHPAVRSSVYNYAVPGYNTVQALAVTKTFVPDVDPDHIILGFFTANDLIHNAVMGIDDQGRMVTNQAAIQAIRAEIRSALSVLYHSVVVRIIALPVYMPRLRYQIATRAKIIEASYRRLRAIQRFAADRDMAFSVVLIHPRDGVAGGLVQAWSGSRKVALLLRAFCEAEGIDVLDLLDVMNGPEDRARFLYPKDGHFNKAGTAVVARALYDTLIAKRLDGTGGR